MASRCSVVPEYRDGDKEAPKPAGLAATPPTLVPISDIRDVLADDRSINKAFSLGAGYGDKVVLTMPRVRKKGFLKKVLAKLNSDPKVAGYYTWKLDGGELTIKPNATPNMLDNATNYANTLGGEDAGDIEKVGGQIAYRSSLMHKIDEDAKKSPTAQNLDKPENRARLANELMGHFMDQLKEVTKQKIENRNNKTGIRAWAGKVGRSKLGKVGKGLGFVAATVVGSTATGGLALGAHIGAGLLGRNAGLNFIDKYGGKNVYSVSGEVSRLVRNTVGENPKFDKLNRVARGWGKVIEKQAKKMRGGSNEEIRWKVANMVMKEADAVMADLEKREGWSNKLRRNLTAMSGAALLSFGAGAVANHYDAFNHPAVNTVTDSVKRAGDWVYNTVGGVDFSHGWTDFKDAAGRQLKRVGGWMF